MIQLKKIIPVKWKAYDPKNKYMGYVNVFEFNDLRLQIAKERAEGYYLIFEDIRINIKPNGSCDRWPNGFFDQYETQLRELISFKFLNTSEKWQELYPNPVVLDPDGWDRTNYDYSWKEELISYNEYSKRRMLSTCIMNNGSN